MPINYKLYHPKWSLISRLIRFVRAKNCCEKCGVGNYLVTRKNKIDGSFEIRHYHGSNNYKSAKELCNHTNTCEEDGEGKWVVVVLTVAHIDHDKTNNKFSNLAALCQRCHLKHDIKQHTANRKYGRHHKEKHQLKLKI